MFGFLLSFPAAMSRKTSLKPKIQDWPLPERKIYRPPWMPGRGSWLLDRTDAQDYTSDTLSVSRGGRLRREGNSGRESRKRSATIL